jgi:small GTP-binding protein
MSPSNDQDFTYKILLLGDAGVGKTSLIQRYLHGKFSKAYVNTVGMEPYNRFETISDYKILLNIWDIAGESKFSTLRQLFYKGAKGCLVSFDLTRRETFENVDIWIDEAEKYAPNQTFVLVGNKNDLKDQREVFRREGNQKARELEKCITYIETSALSGQRVTESFHALAEELLKNDFKKRAGK